MFDTSVVRPVAVAASRRYALLTASIVFHSAAVFAALAMSVATVDFPAAAPHQMEILRPVSAVVIPPAIGDGERPRSAAEKQAPAPPQNRVTVPAAVPSEAAPVENASAVEALAGEGLEEGEGGGTGGHPDGDPFGIGEGTPGGFGTIGGPLLPVGEVRAARVLRRVEPRYPPAMIGARIRTAVVTVRGVVDRHGRLRDAEILTSSWAPFNDAVLEALGQWTFAPGTLRGQPVDTWFELTVRFEVR